MHFVFLRSVRRLRVTANVLSLPILVTLMMAARSSSELSVLPSAARRNIQEAAILDETALEFTVPLSLNMYMKYTE
jgi:hypothetical protein